MISNLTAARVFGQTGKYVTFVHNFSIDLSLAFCLERILEFRFLDLKIEKTDCLGRVTIVVVHWTDRSSHRFAFNCPKELRFRKGLIYGFVVDAWRVWQALYRLFLRAVNYVARGISESSLPWLRLLAVLVTTLQLIVIFART